MSFTFQGFVLAALVVSLAGCDCGTSTRKKFPKIEVLDESGNTRSMLEFGQVQLNFKAIKTVRIRNGGVAPLNLEKAEFSKALFALDTSFPAAIAVGALVSQPSHVEFPGYIDACSLSLPDHSPG
jgi:hypothetical protein